MNIYYFWCYVFELKFKIFDFLIRKICFDNFIYGLEKFKINISYDYNCYYSLNIYGCWINIVDIKWWFYVGNMVISYWY